MNWPTRIGTLVLCAGSVVFLQAADNAALKQSISQLFQVGWGTSLDARKAADAAHESASGSDARATYAYALVLVKQGRYSDAGSQLSLLLAKDKQDVYVWRSRAWLLMLQKKYTAALVDLEKLAEVVSATKDRAERNSLNEDLARFLGRMYGFLEGPAGSQVSDVEREKSRQKVTDLLPENLRPLLDDAAADVLAQYKALTTEKKTTQDKAAAEADVERDKLMADLDKQEEQLVARRESLQPQRDKAKNDMKSELTGLEAKDQPLAEALVPLVARANAISNEMNLLQADINRLRALALAEKDPARKAAYLRRVEDLRLFGLRYSSDLSDAQARIDEIALRRNELRARAAEVQARYNNQVGSVDKEISDLDGQQKKIQAQRNAKKPSATSTARVGALSAQASALTTYDTFPLEAEKQRLLDSLSP